MALLCYTGTIIPSIFRTVLPATKKSKLLRWLFTNRRQIGVTAFSFGLNHGTLLILEKHISLLEPYTYIKYFSGISTLIVFTILAITSNNWSVKNLKLSWKKLHQLTYLVIFILPWHVLATMEGYWSRLTPLQL